MFAIFQLYFHPLSKYPGPVLAKFTNLYSAYHAWRGDIHEDMWRCHERYGQYMNAIENVPRYVFIVSLIKYVYLGEHVRYAPNRLLFYSAHAAKGNVKERLTSLFARKASKTTESTDWKNSSYGNRYLWKPKQRYQVSGL